MNLTSRFEYLETMRYELVLGHDDHHVRDLSIDWLICSELATMVRDQLTEIDDIGC